MTFILGIDDAGKSPVIGNYYIAGVLIPNKRISMLNGIRDSKTYNSKQIDTWYKKIMTVAEAVKTVKIPATRISKSNNINTTIMRACVKIIKHFSVYNIMKIYVDNWEHSSEHWFNRARSVSSKKFYPYLKTFVIAEHHADEKYIPCTAAGVVARWNWDRHMEVLNKRFNIGCGQASDSRTIAFIKKYLNTKHQNLIRMNWVTVKKVKDGTHPLLRKVNQ